MVSAGFVTLLGMKLTPLYEGMVHGGGLSAADRTRHMTSHSTVAETETGKTNILKITSSVIVKCIRHGITAAEDTGRKTTNNATGKRGETHYYSQKCTVCSKHEYNYHRQNRKC